MLSKMFKSTQSRCRTGWFDGGLTGLNLSKLTGVRRAGVRANIESPTNTAARSLIANSNLIFSEN